MCSLTLYPTAQALLAGKEHVVIADHSGSGKTLAYLTPLVQQLLDEEASGGARVAQPRCPAVIVMTPTNELASQASPTSPPARFDQAFHRFC